MSVQPIQFLAWDTQQLGVLTARLIFSPWIDPLILRETLENARHQAVRLLYFAIPSEAKNMISAAKQLGGLLVDRKISYFRQVDTAKTISFANNNIDNTIKVYTEKIPSPDLIMLAYESGKYSRFQRDPNISKAKFQQIYQQWMVNSVNHTIADRVFVHRTREEITGMITVSEKDTRGDIGLLAVSEKTRGKHIGTMLIVAAHNYFIEKNYRQSQVVTQQENIPACCLYKKCGYAIEKIDYFFHFWL